jgi:hypothetical protein
MMDQDKQSLEDSSVIDHLVTTFGTLGPTAPEQALAPAEPVEVYDQIRRTAALGIRPPDFPEGRLTHVCSDRTRAALGPLGGSVRPRP